MHDTTGLVSCQRCVLAGYFTLLEVAMVGAGKSATIEDTGFLKSYDGLASASDNADPGLPDLYYFYFVTPPMGLIEPRSVSDRRIHARSVVVGVVLR